ncbi:MAG: SDR family NAD(P)-dependent oxidoreductase [Terracidiphilus sp.]
MKENDLLGLSPKRLMLLALEQAAEIDRLKMGANEPIAIVGIGCRFPGGASSADTYWELLREGRSAIRSVPSDRWNIGDYYDENPDSSGKMATRWGGFLDVIDRFDAEFFGISPRECITMDPQQRLMLEVCWEALEDAAIAPHRLERQRAGVFMGVTGGDYIQLLSSSHGVGAMDAYALTGNARNAISGRISYVLGLSGPSLVVDTACSSSLVAVHLACQSLGAKQSNLALAGGVNIILSPEITIAGSRAHMLAPDGLCKTFDASADGFVRSEGCGVVVLKRLSEAQADGDRIIALIRSTAVNQDGHTSGFTVPNGKAQEQLLTSALASAGVAGARISYLEAHGTGTRLGDPVEVAAAARVLGAGRPKDRPLILASVKTNLGHLEAAAGIAGLIKAALALDRGQIPPHLHLQNLNSAIDLESIPAVIPRALIDWPSNGSPRLAGVSSFGASGTNAHVVLEQAPRKAAADPIPAAPSLLCISARTQAALPDLAARYLAWTDDHADLPFPVVCWSANTGRAEFEHRLALLASTVPEAGRLLRSFLDNRSVPELFTGQIVSNRAPEVISSRAPLPQLAAAWTSGKSINWADANIPPETVRVPLPLYPFQRARYWPDDRASQTPSATSNSAALTETQVLEWRESNVTKQEKCAAGRWLVFADRDFNDDVPGEVVVLPVPSRVTAEELVQHLAQWNPSHVAYIANGSGIRDLNETIEHSCWFALALMQALAKAPSTSPRSLFLVTRGASTVDRSNIDLAHAPLWGLGRTLLLEFPDVAVSLVDLDASLPEPSLEPLLSQLVVPSAEPQQAFHGGTRFVPRLIQQPLPSATSVGVRPDATYLIAGGIGSLGLTIAASLVESGARRLILIGRSKPGLKAQAEIAALSASGAQIVFEALDISHAEALRAALARYHDPEFPLRGVVQAAGVLSDATVLHQSQDSLARVLPSKVGGSWNLHAATLDIPLDWFILFSSTASLLGSAGQANYAAANAFQDALSHYRRALSLPALAINWSPWQGEGMMATLDDSMRRRREELGLRSLERSAAAAVFLRLTQTASASPQIAVTAFDWKKLAASVGKIPPVLSDICPHDVPGSATPLLLKKLEPVKSLEEKRAAVTEFVQLAASAVLGRMPPLPLHQGFIEMGMDSLMAMELRNALQAGVGHQFTLPSTLVFENPDVPRMTAFLSKLLDSSHAPELQPIAPKRDPQSPVAIVGIGCRFPGGVHDPESFWDLLRSARVAVTPIPPDRWTAEDWYDPNPEAQGKMYTREGAFLEDVDQFDAEFFGISPREAASMDPQQRLLLEVSWEALESASLDPARIPGTGVFVGISTNDYLQRMSAGLQPQDLDAYIGLGNSLSAAAGRISFHLGLAGPSMVVDTACSSSLVAIHLAARSLVEQECNVALAGGVNLILSPFGNVHLCRAGMLAPDGRSKPFDASANGYGRGEGCAVLVLKRLNDALASGDRIYAVIRGTAVNQDGHSAGFTVPDANAQRAVIRAALENAAVESGEISYVEAHGTGTPLGDPIEVSALSGIFGPGRDLSRPLLLGAIKANIGHLEAAAGVAGVIKTALALEHGEAPPQPGFVTPNQHIPWDTIPIRVPTVPTPLPGNGARRMAGVSSFGFVGSNAHVVLEAPPQPSPHPKQSPPSKTHVLALSAKSALRLHNLALAYHKHLAACEPEHFGDLCFTANTRRAVFDHRLAIEASDVEQALERLDCFLNEQSGPGVFAGTALDSPPPPGRSSHPAADWVRGFAVDWSEFYPQQEHRLQLIPSTPFLRKRYWFAERKQPLREAASSGDIPLLGRLTTSPAMRDTVFETTISADSPAWVADHRVQETIVIPGAAHLASVCQAALLQLGDTPIAIEEAEFLRANLFAESETRVSQLVLTKDEDRFFFKVLSCKSGQERDPSAWTAHAEGRVASNQTPDVASLSDASRLAAQWQKANGAELYKRIDAVGIRLGPRFRWVQSLSCGTSQALGLLSAPESEAGLYALHPGLIDSCFQMIAAAYRNYPHNEAEPQIYVPVSVKHLAYLTAPRGSLWCHAWTVGTESLDKGVIEGGFSLFNADGVLAVAASGVRMQRAPAEVLLRSLDTQGDGWLYQVAWRKLPTVAPGNPSEAGEWIVAGDSGALASELKPALGGPGRGVVYLCTEPEADGPDIDITASAVRRCSGLLETVKLTCRSVQSSTRLYIVTRGAQPAGGSRYVTRPDLAALWGLGRVLASEEPSLNPTLIDLDPEVEDKLAIQSLLAEIASGDGETQVAFRNGERLGARIERLRESPMEPTRLRPDGTYLITGGSGGLGLAFCRWLTDCGARRVILASRRGESPEVSKLAAELSQTGCELIAFAADVSRETDVAALLRIAHLPDFPLLGILHCAGVLDNAPCSELTREQFETVFRPKVEGAIHLHRATRNIVLDFFVLFSSASSLLGSPGQGNYAAANACLDALAHSRRADDLATLSVNWGPWLNAGMTASVSARQRSQWESSGVHLIPASDGVRMLGHLLRSGQTEAAVLPVDWPLFLSRVADGRVPSLLAMFASSQTAAPSTSSRARLLEADAAARPALLLEEIRARIAAVLALGSADEVDPDIRLFALGLDSIMALELKMHFEREFGLHLPATLIFDYPTPRLLSNYLFTELFGAEPESPAEPDESIHEELDRIIDEEYSRVMRQFDA